MIHPVPEIIDLFLDKKHKFIATCDNLNGMRNSETVTHSSTGTTEDCKENHSNVRLPQLEQVLLSCDVIWKKYRFITLEQYDITTRVWKKLSGSTTSILPDRFDFVWSTNKIA